MTWEDHTNARTVGRRGIRGKDIVTTRAARSGFGNAKTAADAGPSGRRHHLRQHPNLPAKKPQAQNQASTSASPAARMGMAEIAQLNQVEPDRPTGSISRDNPSMELVPTARQGCAIP